MTVFHDSQAIHVVQSHTVLVVGEMSICLHIKKETSVYDSPDTLFSPSEALSQTLMLFSCICLASFIIALSVCLALIVIICSLCVQFYCPYSPY